MKFKTLLGSWILGIFALSGTAAAETKEGGEKGGTQDINIGLGELQEGEEKADGKQVSKVHKKKAKRKARKKAAKKKARKMKHKKHRDEATADREILREGDAASATKKKKAGKVEATWKVEEGEK